MSNRKRINLSLSAPEFDAITELAARSSFNGVCAFVTALIGAFIEYSRKAKKRKITPQTIQEEITEMFNKLAECESLEDTRRLTTKNSINQRK